MASCSDDLDVSDKGPGQILENETTTYVRVSLMGSGMSRADYELGSSDESMVQSILLTFFDAGRNYVGKATIDVNENNEIEVPDDLPNTLERILTVVAPVTLPENINYPKYVIAYVNPTSAHQDLATEKCEDVQKIIRDRATVSHNGYRTMNNSVYFSEDTGYSRFATEVDFKKHFYETMEDAKKADAASIEITVERMEAKVRLSNILSDLKPKPFETQIDENGSAKKYKLEFVPQGWFVNATEKRSFLLKNYRSSRSNVLEGNFPEVDFGMKLSELKNVSFKANIENRPGDTRYNEFNDATNLRSYWAIDPTYFTTANETEDLYPDVSYDVKYGEVNASAGDYPLLYRSYAKVMAENNSHTSTNYVKFNGNVKSHEYVLENTMSLNTLSTNDALASMTSVVLLGYYKVIEEADEGGSKTVFDGSDATINQTNKSFYIRHEADSKYYVMLSDEEAMDFFLERGGSTLFVQTIDKDGKPVDNSFEPLRAAHIKDSRYGVSYNDFELKYPDKNLAGKKLSEQWRTMVLKKKTSGYNSKIYIYDATIDEGNGGYRSITDADMNKVSATLYSSFGVLEKFQTGKAYFNVPLKHIWGAGNTSNEFNAKTVMLGDYGVVRNHIYDLSINKIEGLGTGIGDINQPIVPPTKNDQYYISARLRILEWRLVSQSVDL